jgi:hypothetical protein
MEFNFAFSSQSFDACSTNSTLQTSFALFLANIIPIVQVQAYKSRTLNLSKFSLCAKSKTLLYKTSAQ